MKVQINFQFMFLHTIKRFSSLSLTMMKAFKTLIAFQLLSLILAFMVICGYSHAEVKLNGLFTNGAVLQQGIKIPVWGTALPGEAIRVRIAKQDLSTRADKKGKWRISLSSMSPGGPYLLTISGKNEIRLKNVYVGEVFLCAGQSNMEFPLWLAKESQSAISTSSDPQLHLYIVPHSISAFPSSSVQGVWEAAEPDSVRNFSAIAFYFGRALRKALKVPVGLIQATVGGAPAQAWTSRIALEAEPLLKQYVSRYESAKIVYAKELETYPTLRDKHLKEVEIARLDKTTAPPAPKSPGDPSASSRSPSLLFNGMIAPLIPYGISGCIWYQGESNTGDASSYRTLFSTMISNWRNEWKQGDFPFLFVQLAPFLKREDAPTESAWAELREAQRLTSEQVRNTGMTVTTDVGEEGEILPRQKEVVGERLAALARKLIFRHVVEASGPAFRGVLFEGGKGILTFAHAESGLEARNGVLTGFTIAGEDKIFVKADAGIEEGRVLVSSPKVPNPVAIRYGWADYPTGNLWNKAGFPASPFRTDNFELRRKASGR